MTKSSVGLARSIVRNSAALFLLGVISKGMGLIIAVMLARFLGKDAVGLYAMLFTVSVLVEVLISIGMSDSLVRDVAARRSQATSLYFNALRLAVGVSIVPAIGLAVAAMLVGDQGDTRASLLVLAVSTPVAGAFVVSQAVLQGAERVMLLTWVSLITRIASLAWLAFALSRGDGVAAGFVSKLMFQLASVVVFFAVLWRDRNGAKADFSPWALLSRSFPFALNRAIRDLHVRLPALVLPGTMGLAPAGVFDAANRIRSTLGMSMGAMIVGLMPSFARNVGDDQDNSDRLIGYSLKYMCLTMSAAATVLALAAGWIIQLLYGPDFAAAAQPLQLLVWAQVLVAVDAVLQQAMLATGHEYAAARHSTYGVVGQLLLILATAPLLGLAGVSVAVLLASALPLALDLGFVVKNVASIQVRRFVTGPLVAGSVVACMMFAARNLAFPLQALVAAGGWGVTIGLFRLLPHEELRFMMQLVSMRRAKRAPSQGVGD